MTCVPSVLVLEVSPAPSGSITAATWRHTGAVWSVEVHTLVSVLSDPHTLCSACDSRVSPTQASPAALTYSWMLPGTVDDPSVGRRLTTAPPWPVRTHASRVSFRGGARQRGGAVGVGVGALGERDGLPGGRRDRPRS